MGLIRVVGWDIDKVAHISHSNIEMAKINRIDPSPKIKRYISAGVLPQEYVNRWQEANGPLEKSNERAAYMVTDGLYSWGFTEAGRLLLPEEVVASRERGGKIKPVLSKETAKTIKCNLLRGLTFRDAKRVAENLDFTPGFRDAVKAFRDAGIIQTLYSDGLGMVADHLVKIFGFDCGGGVPPYVEIRGKKILYQGYDNTPDDGVLTGELGKYDKSAEFFKWLEKEGISLDRVAVIDDLVENIPTLLKPVKNAGGIAVGFNVSEQYRHDFEQAGIETIEGQSLKPFINLVLRNNR